MTLRVLLLATDPVFLPSLQRLLVTQTPYLQIADLQGARPRKGEIAKPVSVVVLVGHVAVSLDSLVNPKFEAPLLLASEAKSPGILGYLSLGGVNRKEVRPAIPLLRFEILQVGAEPKQKTIWVTLIGNYIFDRSLLEAPEYAEVQLSRQYVRLVVGKDYHPRPIVPYQVTVEGAEAGAILLDGVQEGGFVS